MTTKNNVKELPTSHEDFFLTARELAEFSYADETRTWDPAQVSRLQVAAEHLMQATRDVVAYVYAEVIAPCVLSEEFVNGEYSFLLQKLKACTDTLNDAYTSTVAGAQLRLYKTLLEQYYPLYLRELDRYKRRTA